MTDAVTAVDTLVVEKGCGDAFDAWLADYAAALPDGVVRLDQAGGIVHLLHRFDSRAAADAWQASARRRALVAIVARYAIIGTRAAAGPQPRLTLPSQESAPRWKRILVSWATVFPLLLATAYAGQAVVPHWPRPLTLALSSLAITLALNLVIFPRLNRRLDPWLLQGEDGGVARRGG